MQRWEGIAKLRYGADQIIGALVALGGGPAAHREDYRAWRKNFRQREIGWSCGHFQDVDIERPCEFADFLCRDGLHFGEFFRGT